MRYRPEHTEQTRVRMLEATGREFRRHGFGGVGIDGLAKAADVTSGALYGHFRSKAGAFRAAAVAGLERLAAGVAHFRGGHGQDWFKAFTTYYLGQAHRDDVAGGCALPSLTPDVTRADPATQEAYRDQLLKVAALLAEGLPGAAGRAAAWPVLAQLAGGVMLARAVGDETVAQEIAEAVLGSVLASNPPEQR